MVLHAAAHKHVPLMEQHPIEAVCVNVIGTMNVTEMSVAYAASRFVQVSTDKAVKPSSVMGATKRIGEFIVGSQAVTSDTDFGIVRFGNVLGSRGSLIPSLEAQIRRGGPIRLTHPEMTRYFMTIHEAVQLVMHAGSQCKNGEVFILDMGLPVRISLIADRVIRMHGLVVGKDIDIQYTGIRPGEKLHEELVHEREDMIPTTHPNVQMVRNGNPFEWSELKSRLLEIELKCKLRDAESVRQAIMELSRVDNSTLREVAESIDQALDRAA